ncbi:hypothetical protein RN001_008978 [Aquatica leii]|uniref:Uncharacterized protein n=1 Tax=Aquatica leii TaxID=1421715 RepID=A0AAN7SH75_9COLE|nr:hypothetical protein RN001_008978 [Aquatica leii]
MADIYPSYHKIQAAKKACYPLDEAITITEALMEVQLQALLDLTIRRLVLSQEEVFTTMANAFYKNFVLISKWGCDGSTGHSEYKKNLQTIFGIVICS